jgi:peptidoglycan-associated lipoprotein
MTKAVTITALVLALGLSACAKQPSTTSASAPAPGGAAGGGSSSADAMRQAGGAHGDGGRGGTMTGAGSRPDVKDFRPASDLVDIHFDYDRAEIREDDAKVLDANAVWLKSNISHLVLIEGHCDERGTSEYNTALGDRRAKATMNYLVSRGVPAARITVISYGEERPVCGQHVAECWAKNRRAHFRVKAR